MTLNGLIGRRGHINTLEYWCVGRFIIISILAKDTSRVCLASERMFILRPPIWYLKSVLKDVMLMKNTLQESEDKLFFTDKVIGIFILYEQSSVLCLVCIYFLAFSYQWLILSFSPFHYSHFI